MYVGMEIMQYVGLWLSLATAGRFISGQTTHGHLPHLFPTA